MEIIEKKVRNHFELKDIETFLRLNEYPNTNGVQYPNKKEWGARSNVKRACKCFSIKNWQFLYK